jgi:hypothetical protein
MTRSGCGAALANVFARLRSTWFDTTPTTYGGVALGRAPYHRGNPNGRPGSTPGPSSFSRSSSKNGGAGSARRVYNVATSGLQDERRWRLIGITRKVLPTWMQVQFLPAGLCGSSSAVEHWWEHHQMARGSTPVFRIISRVAQTVRPC